MVLYWEGEDADHFIQALSEFVASDDPYGSWLRDRFADLFGVDASEGLPPGPELLRDFRIG